jgi:acetolactate synthase-1/2/3 large subunit
MGIQAAFPKRRVAAFVGDGGFLLSSNELATAVQHFLPVVIFLGNDNAYGSIRFLQEKQFGADYQAELKNPDFIQYARSFGCLAVRAEGPEDLEKVSSLLVAQGNIPLLIEMDFEIPRLPYEPV